MACRNNAQLFSLAYAQGFADVAVLALDSEGSVSDFTELLVNATAGRADVTVLNTEHPQRHKRQPGSLLSGEISDACAVLDAVLLACCDVRRIDFLDCWHKGLVRFCKTTKPMQLDMGIFSSTAISAAVVLCQQHHFGGLLSLLTCPACRELMSQALSSRDVLKQLRMTVSCATQGVPKTQSSGGECSSWAGPDAALDISGLVGVLTCFGQLELLTSLEATCPPEVHLDATATSKDSVHSASPYLSVCLLGQLGRAAAACALRGVQAGPSSILFVPRQALQAAFTGVMSSCFYCCGAAAECGSSSAVGRRQFQALVPQRMDAATQLLALDADTEALCGWRISLLVRKQYMLRIAARLRCGQLLALLLPAFVARHPGAIIPTGKRSLLMHLRGKTHRYEEGPGLLFPEASHTTPDWAARELLALTGRHRQPTQQWLGHTIDMVEDHGSYGTEVAFQLDSAQRDAAWLLTALRRGRRALLLDRRSRQTRGQGQSMQSLEQY